MTETIITETEIIQIDTRIRRTNKVVPWDDIKTEIEPDYDMPAPWEDCDGYEHEVVWNPTDKGYPDDIQNAKGYGWSDRRDFLITIDDDTVFGWGFGGDDGSSKQVRAEEIAFRKAECIKLLTKWYEHGWECWWVRAEYEGYDDSLGGIYDDDYTYTKECAEDCRHNVADQLEEAGYIVTGRPERKVWSAVDNMRDRIARNLGRKA